MIMPDFPQNSFDKDKLLNSSQNKQNINNALLVLNKIVNYVRKKGTIKKRRKRCKDSQNDPTMQFTFLNKR